jgi:hypothetical protein
MHLLCKFFFCGALFLELLDLVFTILEDIIVPESVIIDGIVFNLPT